MIHYQLRCAEAHEFDGWFKDSDNFELQAKRQLIACPVCGSAKVDRALMAPRLGRKIIDTASEAIVPPVTSISALPVKPQIAGGVMPDSLRGLLGKLRAEVEKSCDYVGDNFAKEARRIHNGEAEPRGIYGQSNEAEAEALAEDGIEVARIPWVPRADS